MIDYQKELVCLLVSFCHWHQTARSSDQIQCSIDSVADPLLLLHQILLMFSWIKDQPMYEIIEKNPEQKLLIHNCCLYILQIPNQKYWHQVIWCSFQWQSQYYPNQDQSNHPHYIKLILTFLVFFFWGAPVSPSSPSFSSASPVH